MGARPELVFFCPQAIVDEICQELDLAFGELVAKRGHAVAAICDLIVDLGFGLKFKFANAKARNDLAVDGLAIAFGAVTDSTLLTKKRSFVGLAISDDIAVLLWAGTSNGKK